MCWLWLQCTNRRELGCRFGDDVDVDRHGRWVVGKHGLSHIAVTDLPTEFGVLQTWQLLTRDVSIRTQSVALIPHQFETAVIHILSSIRVLET